MKLWYVLILLGLSGPVSAEPRSLQIDASQKKVSNKMIRKAHEVIKHNKSLKEARFAILNAALTSRNIKWILEKDADDFIEFRWDYNGASIYTRVDYGKGFIQLKYANAYDDYRCENNIDGICYYNEDRAYYKYLGVFREAIVNEIN